MRVFIQSHKLDVIIVSETKLTPEINIKVKNFNVIRKDRTAHGGGVAIIIRNTVPYKLIGNNNTVSIENTCIQLKDGTYIIAVYNQPRNQFTIGDLHSLANKGNKVLIVGDFNARHQAWKNQACNRNGSTLFNFITNSNMILQCSNNPTHFPENGMTPSYIDLILNKNVREITEPKSIAELNSDHNPQMFQIYSQKKENSTKTVTSYKNTDTGTNSDKT